MKICVLSHARCRSSILVTSLANAYNIPNLQEDYGDVKKFSYKERQLISKSSDKERETLNIYTNKLQTFTDKLFSENDNFVIKVWPRFFNATEFCYNTNSFVKNLEKTFRFSQYDKIILSNRDALDAVCSLSLAIKYGYNYNDEKLANYGKTQRYKNIQHNKVDLHEWNKSFIVEILLLDQVRQYLDKTNIPYDFVPFSKIPDYISTFPQPQAAPKWYLPIDTQIDYSQAVVNYCDVKQEIEKYKQTLAKVINNITFIGH